MMHTIKNCSVCAQPFECNSCLSQQCWCSKLPTIMPLCEGQDCRCPSCLRTVIGEQISHYLQQNPVTTVIPQQYHNTQLIEDIDYYLEDGKWVFTEWYHRKRGSCCGNGCRHCPYQYINMKSKK